MSETKQLSQEELQKIQDIRKNYVNIQTAFGQLHLTRLNLEKQLTQLDVNSESLSAEYEKTQQAEQDLVKSIQDKYGVGSLDIETGTFTPNS
jgi:lipid II:glycine glycyltransferase (peptidoglycan interpeptide bridge formation enzyme)|tara:strand:- start:148 stop:423 length:276 start_codon:yes stop_codon:yes gene_type:complete